MIKYLLLIFLTLFACGRDQPLDKTIFETALFENPYDNDFKPLSSYHGELKEDIIVAKSAAESMGIKFQNIYVRGGSASSAVGECRYYKWKKKIVLFPDEMKKASLILSKEARFFYFTQVLVHEWVHCGLNFIDHEASGIMTAEVNKADLYWEAQHQLYQKLNEDHRAGLNLKAFNDFFIKKFKPFYYDGKMGQSRAKITELTLSKIYVSVLNNQFKIKEEETKTIYQENFMMPDLIEKSIKVSEVEPDILDIVKNKNLIFNDDKVFQLINRRVISDKTTINEGLRTIFIREEHLLPVISPSEATNIKKLLKNP